MFIPLPSRKSTEPVNGVPLLTFTSETPALLPALAAMVIFCPEGVIVTLEPATRFTAPVTLLTELTPALPPPPVADIVILLPLGVTVTFAPATILGAPLIPFTDLTYAPSIAETRSIVEFMLLFSCVSCCCRCCVSVVICCVNSLTSSSLSAVSCASSFCRDVMFVSADDMRSLSPLIFDSAVPIRVVSPEIAVSFAVI